MKSALTILVTVLLAAQAATADLSPEFLSASAPGFSPVSPTFPAVAPQPTLPALDSLCTSSLTSPLGGLLSADSATPLGPQVRQLPPPPSADALCLTGLLSIGAFQLLRRAHSSYLALPAWYPPNAPNQIGHTYAYDFEPVARFCPAAAPDGAFGLPPRPPSCRPQQADPASILSTTTPMAVVGPRAPPVC